MDIIKKQFSTFTLSYNDVEITHDNYWKHDVTVSGENCWQYIHGSELCYEFALQIRSDNEQQIRDVIAAIINDRQFYISQLESILKQSSSEGVSNI